MKVFFLFLLTVACFFATTAFGETNNAVARGLDWLAGQQHDDGSWSANVGLNSLSMLAFLSAGQADRKPYRERVEKGLQFILSEQNSDGTFTNNGAMMFGHGITALLLGEMTGMGTHNPQLRAALERAVHVIVQAQQVSKGEFHTGGWRYFTDSTDSDMAVTIWQVTALRAAEAAGVSVPKECLERAAKYIKRCEHPAGGFSYQPGGFVNAGRTAGAIAALRMCNRFDDPAIERSRQWLLKHPLKWEDEYVYHSSFFCAQAGFGFDDALLLRHQNADGSWQAPPNSADEVEAGPLYFTSMAILALTAKEHALPVFSVND